MSLEFPLIHFATIATAVALPTLGVSFGQSYLGLAALKALHRQPRMRADIMRTMLISMALTETAAILGLALSVVLLFYENPLESGLATSIAELGIALAIGLPGFTIGIATAFPGVATLEAIARQPFFARKISNIMLITQTIGQTGIIFGFLTSLFIKFALPSVGSMNDAIKLFSSGLAIGLGSIGPAFGLGRFAQTACENLGYRPESYNKILTFTFITEAIIETPLIFALVVSLLLATTGSTSESMLAGLAYMSAGLVIGIGTFSPGLNSARVAQSAATQISYSPQAYPLISKTSLIAQSLIDTSALYALLISLLMIFLR